MGFRLELLREYCLAPLCGEKKDWKQERLLSERMEMPEPRERGSNGWLRRTSPTRPSGRGDNLDILRGLNSGCVDLIYLDPPFNSNREYAAPVGSKAAGADGT